MSSDSDSSCDDWARLDVDTALAKQAKRAKDREFERDQEEKRQAHIEMRREIVRLEKELDAMVLATEKRFKQLTRARDKEIAAMGHRKKLLGEEIRELRWSLMCPNVGKPLR